MMHVHFKVSICYVRKEVCLCFEDYTMNCHTEVCVIISQFVLIIALEKRKHKLLAALFSVPLCAASKAHHHASPSQSSRDI